MSDDERVMTRGIFNLFYFHILFGFDDYNARVTEN